MRDDEPLSDNQAHDRLHAAHEILGTAKGETEQADTALSAARKALKLLAMALVAASAALKE